MKTAIVFSVPAAVPAGFIWKWRASDGSKQSHSAFAFFYQCVENANAAGYTVDLNTARNTHSEAGLPHGFR